MLAIASGVFAQSSSQSFSVPRQSIDSGAGRAGSASYSLNGVIGQADVGAPMSSASFSLRGGFHRVADTPASADALFADGFESP